MPKNLANFERNLPKTFAFWQGLSAWHPPLVVRCPVLNMDGTPIADDDVKGCGSSNLDYDGEMYDCLDCGIFFSDYAADPPHQMLHGPDTERK